MIDKGKVEEAGDDDESVAFDKLLVDEVIDNFFARGLGTLSEEPFESLCVGKCCG